MNESLLVFQSVTYAQKALRILRQFGISGSVIRIPMQYSVNGCGYALRVRPIHVNSILKLLSNYNLKPIKILSADPNGYHEVSYGIS